MTVQDIAIAHTIWVNNIAALKCKTTRKKPTHVIGDIVDIPKELVKLHKEEFMTADIFFVNRIPFCILLSHIGNFTTMIHLEDIKAVTIFKASKEIYMYDLKHGFQVTTLHVDGKPAPLQSLMLKARCRFTRYHWYIEFSG